MLCLIRISICLNQLTIEFIGPSADSFPIPVISFRPDAKDNTQPEFQAFAKRRDFANIQNSGKESFAHWLYQSTYGRKPI